MSRSGAGILRQTSAKFDTKPAPSPALTSHVSGEPSRTMIGPRWSSDTLVSSDTRPAATRLGMTWRHVDAKSTAYR
jgi:hypothetical protein